MEGPPLHGWQLMKAATLVLSAWFAGISGLLLVASLPPGSPASQSHPFQQLFIASRTSGRGSLKLFRCQFSQTYDACLLSASLEPSHPGPTWPKHSKWEEIVPQPTTIAMTLVQATSVFYLMVRGWKLSPQGQEKNKNADSYQSHSMPRWELSSVMVLVMFLITDLSDTQIHYWMGRVWCVHI